MKTLSLALGLVLVGTVSGQELLWELHTTSGVRHGGVYPEFGDYDGDGSADLLVSARDQSLSTWWPHVVRVFSGVDGALLDEMYHPHGLGQFAEFGDHDQDGVPDVICSGPAGSGYAEVWSLATKQMLMRFHLPVLAGPYGTRATWLDCSGDGRLDLVYGAADGSLVMHDHKGHILYTIPALSLGFVPAAIAAVGDLDGDGCDDFVVGAFEYHTGQSRGAVILFSGKTGTPLRIHWGPQPFDFLNRDVRAAGDVDGDGVMDYAAGNWTGSRGLIVIWSGATGNVIREWSHPDPRYLVGRFLAGVDVDLDGRPDIVDMAGGYPNIPGQVSHQGRVRTLSSRDGQDLVHVASQQWTVYFADSYANLGVQPGNPYPVFAIVDDPVVPPYNNWPRIRVYRCTPAGTRFVGSGCSSSGGVPTIGIRRTDGVATDGSRLVLGSAPVNAIAVLVAAPTSLTLPSPVPLDFLGLPGCDLLVPPALCELRITGAVGMGRGYAAFDFPSPMAATGGVEFAAQWVVLDPTTSAYATTQRYEFRVE